MPSVVTADVDKEILPPNDAGAQLQAQSCTGNCYRCHYWIIPSEYLKPNENKVTSENNVDLFVNEEITNPKVMSVPAISKMEGCVDI